MTSYKQMLNRGATSKVTWDSIKVILQGNKRIARALYLDN